MPARRSTILGRSKGFSRTTSTGSFFRHFRAPSCLFSETKCSCEINPRSKARRALKAIEVPNALLAAIRTRRVIGDSRVFSAAVRGKRIAPANRHASLSATLPLSLGRRVWRTKCPSSCPMLARSRSPGCPAPITMSGRPPSHISGHTEYEGCLGNSSGSRVTTIPARSTALVKFAIGSRSPIPSCLRTLAAMSSSSSSVGEC